jgi:EmrB/QacA subfamily drug resistance transporter
MTGESIERGPAIRWVLASLALCMLLPSLGTSVANVALPVLAEAFSASFQQVQWVVLAYLLTTTTLIVGVGRLGDVVGRRGLLMAGIATFTAASAVCAVAPQLWLLIAGRAAQGLGAAVMLALTMAFVAEAVPTARIGSAMGLLGTMSAVGTALGPSLGGVLIESFGWHAIFVVNVPLGVAAFALARRCLPADRRVSTADRTRFDHVGTVLLALTLSAYALAMTLGRGSFGAVNISLLAAAALGVGLFVRAEARAAFPLISLATFRDPMLGAGLAMSTLVSTVMMATLVVGPFYLARALGLDMALVGIAMSVGPAAAALSGVPGGRIVDRFGARRAVAAGLGGMAVGCAVLFLAPTEWGIAAFLVPIVVVTANYALFQAANNTSVMKNVSSDRRGTVSGMLNLSRNLGLITGASVMAAVFAFASGARDFSNAPPDAIAFGMRCTFAVAAGLLAVALIIALASPAPSRHVNRS